MTISEADRERARRQNEVIRAEQKRREGLERQDARLRAAVDDMFGVSQGIFHRRAEQRAREALQPRTDKGPELEQLREQMADPNSAYWKGEQAEQLQQRYRDLVATAGPDPFAENSGT